MSWVRGHQGPQGPITAANHSLLFLVGWWADLGVSRGAMGGPIHLGRGDRRVIVQRHVPMREWWTGLW